MSNKSKPKKKISKKQVKLKCVFLENPVGLENDVGITTLKKTSNTGLKIPEKERKTTTLIGMQQNNQIQEGIEELEEKEIN